MRTRSLKSVLAGGVCALAISSAAVAQAKDFDVPAGDLDSALDAYIRQSGEQLIYKVADVRGMKTRGVSGELTADAALARLLEGTSLQVRRDPSGLIAVTDAQAPQSGSAAGDGADGTVEALIVTAQKREEDIQDVPIAISAFTQESLERSQVAGGPDLMTQVPNMTFTKTNFSSYSIQLRGIGTQAISATTDPAVAVAFNNTPFVRNRFFEQEFYDLQRVEVLRGPQGTLYGRNATAGVVNIISQKPKFAYEAKVSADVANYNSTRLEGMVNVPLVDDVVALRLAGAWTRREGYSTNEITGNPIDGRDLWSTRASLRFAPTDRLDVNLIWEHFEEDDDRLRSGKQLCKTHEVTEVAGFETTHLQTLPEIGQRALFSGVQATFSQGCLPSSLYSPDSFNTPNGLSLPYYVPLGSVGLPIALQDPYVSRTQSHDLRVIESTVDPEYRAKSDVVELQATFDLSDALTLSSETAWASDFIFSTQDFNRFNTATGAWRTDAHLVTRGVLSADGVFCDPQIGCADRLVAVDLSTARSHHFSQELRLASNFDGRFNFSLGANFLRYDTEDKYYVFVNSLSLIAAIIGSGVSDEYRAANPYVPNVTDNTFCLNDGLLPPDFTAVYSVTDCTYIDPNPIGGLNDQGHNYFLSRNPFKLISYAMFGEAYYQITDNLKVTAGLRFTVDKKEAPRVPSWLLASQTIGYPVEQVVEQEWREPTGRLAVDWKPDLGFTDETLLYASYAHGYKAGGANPPPPGQVAYCPECGGNADVANAKVSETHPLTFDAEFVDAFELGAKNTMADGRVTLNLAAFYYDYRDYQISQIINRSAINDNFDAKVWGLEIEADWRPLENLKLGFKGGYEHTEIADGETAVDVMDRTAGMPGWVVVRPFPTFPSNCILPAWLFVGNTGAAPANPELVNLGGKGGGNPGACELAYSLGFDPVTRAVYQANPAPGSLPLTHDGVINYTAYSTDPAFFAGWPEGVPITDRTYPGWNPATAPNGGEGFSKDLSGNELPNAPAFTATITADYTVPLPSDWLMTLHTDLYYQSEAWTRIFNTEGYDKLKAYTNVNLAAIFTNEDAGWKVMAYIKNVFDRDSITGAFLNSDDTGLTTNVFLTEPRLYGLRVTKEFTGGPWWTGASADHTGPYPLTVELGGQVQRHDAAYGPLAPSFADEFDDAVRNFDEVQNRDLDWGDGREVKLTYRPSGGWSVSAGWRSGRANNETARLNTVVETAEVCGVTDFFGAAFLCGPTRPNDDFVSSTTNWAASSARSKEEHELLDFAVGREVGLGGLSRSTLSAGVRYASFESQTVLDASGSPDRYLAQGWALPQFFPAYFAGKYVTNYSNYTARLHAEREFTGAGPVLTWDAALALLGSDQTGHLELDWSVSGGVLFGDRETSISEAGIARHFEDFSGGRGELTGTEEINTAPVSRTDDATVPVAGASLGLAYDAGRLRIGAGYRWERYFDVLDVGFDEEQDGDRTIDGPYFKLSVGFGG